MATTAKTTPKAPAKPEKPTNIFQALIAAQAAIKNVGKNEQNKFDGYKYRGIDDVMDAVHAAFVEAGVVAVPTVIDITQTDRQSRKGEAMIHTVMTVEYRYYAADGTNIATVVKGEALDRGDKSINKCLSSCYKYAMFQTLAIPGSEMIDSETESPEIGKATPAKAPEPKPDPAAQITREAAKKLASVIAEIDKADKSWWPDTRNLYGIAKTTDIKQADYNRIVMAAQARLDELSGGKTSW